MLINAYAFGLYQSLGIFIPLIVTNCIVVGRAEAFAAKKGRRCRRWTVSRSAWALPARCLCWAPCARSLATAPCLTAPTVCLAAGRRFCASRFSTPTPLSCWLCCRRGAFIGLGMMLAIKYLIDERSKQRKAQAARAVSVAPSDVTGKHNMNKAKRLAILTEAAGKRSPPHYRTAFQFAIRAADCRPAFCTGHRRKRQQSDSQTLSGGQYARSDAGPRGWMG